MGAFDLTDYFILGACILSLIGSSSMIYMYFKLQLQNNLALTLICYMSISDFIFSSFNLIYIQPDTIPNTYLCSVQGVALQFAELSQFIFCLELMISIYLSVIKNVTDLQKYRTQFLLLGYVLPFLVSLIPLIGGQYGNIGYSCGFAYKNTQTITKIVTNIEAATFFYLPLWVLAIVNLVLITKVILFIRSLRLNKSDGIQEIHQDQEIKLSQQIIFNLMAYPIIVMVCWSGFTIYRVGKFFGQTFNWLEGTRFVMADFVGFFNSIAYFINHCYYKRLQQILRDESLQQQQMQLYQATKQQQKDSYKSFITSSRNTSVDLMGSFIYY